MGMRISTFGYCMEQGIINIFKNRLMSLAAIGTISACMIVIGIFYTIVSNVDYMMNSMQKNVGVAVFFNEDTSEQQILDVKTQIEGRNEVYIVNYISADEAWDSFKESYFKNREDLLDGFDKENPLKDSASLQVFLSDISKQGDLVNYIQDLPGVRYIREDRQVTEIFQNVSNLIKYVSVALVAILIIISVFLISNTVRLAIELRKVEIKIMKFVGATDAFIRGPFIIEGAIIGFLGALAPLIIIYAFYYDVISRVGSKFSLLNDYLIFMPISQIYSKLLPISLIIAIGIGVVGS